MNVVVEFVLVAFLHSQVLFEECAWFYVMFVSQVCLSREADQIA